jgi:hypothetical protein
MDAGTRETENTLKKELAEIKDQLTVLTKRTAEVHHGKCLVHRREAARSATTDGRACC